jgi:hypothetical protein
VLPSVWAGLQQLGSSLSGLSHALTSPRDLLAVTAIALVGLAVALLARRACVPVAASPLTGRVAALREKSWSAAFQRQLDPDAAGRVRPRAPGACPAA